MTIHKSTNAQLIAIYTESEDREAVVAAGEELARRGVTEL